MKKFCALFLCAFMIIAQTIEFVPINAAGAVDYGEMLNIYIGASEAALALSQGAEIDISTFEYPEELTTNKEKAQYLMKYYGALRNVGVKAIYDWLFDPELNPSGDIVSAETAAIGLSSHTGVGPSGIQDLKAQLDNVLATNSNTHIFQRYSNEVIARWNEYNTNYINSYLENVNYRDNDNPLPPSMQPFESYIAVGNSWNYFCNPTIYNNVYGKNFIRDMYLKSYVSLVFRPQGYTDATNLNINDYLNDASGREIHDIWAYNLNDVDFYCFINSSTHEITFPNVNNMFWLHDEYNNYLEVGCYRNISNYYPLCAAASTYGSKPLYFSFNSNEEAFLWYSKYCVNCPLLFGTSIENAIRVEASGYNISGGLTVTLPNAVIDSGTDDGKIVAHPIYYPDAIVNDGAIDIDLDKLIDGIAARIGAGDTSISMDDVIADGAAVKLDGSTLTDADTATADVSVPIYAAAEGDLTIPLGQVPPLPNLPPIIPPSGMNGNVPDGFAGMSVLARIINVTVQSVPAPIIMTFFGVIFGMIVLGIIKILHH